MGPFEHLETIVYSEIRYKVRSFQGVLAMNKAIASISVLGLVAAGMLFFYIRREQPQPAKKKQARITVFIHGTVFSMLSLFDVRNVYADDLSEGSLYVSLLKEVRKNPLLWQDQPMLSQGWQDIPANVIPEFHTKKLGEQDRKKAICQFVPAYDTFTLHTLNKSKTGGADSVVRVDQTDASLSWGHMFTSLYSRYMMSADTTKAKADDDQVKQVGAAVPQELSMQADVQLLVHNSDTAYHAKTGVARFYHTFGHLGLLSQKYRRQAALELYEGLCERVAACKKDYDTVRVDIVAHSHAGNIVLNLAAVQAEQQQDLTVDNLVMLGTPLQVETAAYAYGSLFKRVINCYSDGDRVQGADQFSTCMRRSHKQFCDEKLIIDDTPAENTYLYDMRLLVNDDAERIGHANMWMLGRSDKATESLDPLSTAVLTPLILDMLDTIETKVDAPQYAHLDCNIIDTDDVVQVVLAAHKQDVSLATTQNIYETAIHLRDAVVHCWEPDTKSRAFVFSYQTGATLWQAIKSLRRGGTSLDFDVEVQEHIPDDQAVIQADQ